LPFGKKSKFAGALLKDFEIGKKEERAKEIMLTIFYI
jgi:hypothetical protein